MEEASKDGFFGVRFIGDKKSGVRAILTGDYWTSSEMVFAKAEISADADEAMIDFSSPIYLVPGRVVQCAMRHKDDNEMVTQMLLQSLAYNAEPDGCYERLERAMGSVLGTTHITVPWWHGQSLPEEEITEIFDAFGVKWNNRKDD